MTPESESKLGCVGIGFGIRGPESYKSLIYSCRVDGREESMGDKSSIVASLWCCQRTKNGSTSSSQPSQSESILKSDICPTLVLTYIASGIYVLCLYSNACTIRLL